MDEPLIYPLSTTDAAYLAGLATGFWSSREEIARQWAVDRRFMPSMPAERRETLYAGWNMAVQATLGFRV